MVEKDEFIKNVTTELGGDYLAKLDASVLWGIYEQWTKSPQNTALMLLECSHKSVTAAIERKKAKHLLR